jgi:hypothetical protein
VRVKLLCQAFFDGLKGCEKLYLSTKNRKGASRDKKIFPDAPFL